MVSVYEEKTEFIFKVCFQGNYLQEKKIKNPWRFKEKYYCVSESNCLIESKPNGDLSLIQK